MGTICRIAIATVISAVASLCDAAVATNAFAVAEGVGIRVAGDNLFHYSVAGQNRSINVTARPGWRFRSGKRTATILLRSGSNDVYEHEVISDLGEDGEDIRYEPCTFEENEEDEHVEAPEVSLAVLSNPGVVLYAAPETEVEVCASVGKVVEEKGIHRKRTTYEPCPVCGNVKPDTDWEYYEKDPGIDEWEAVGPDHTAYSSSWEHAVSYGADQCVQFNLTCYPSDCSSCMVNVDEEAEFDVAEVHVERFDYIGMDRSDVGRSTPVLRTAIAQMQPSIGTTTYSWTDCGICSFEGSTANASANYKLSNPDASSSGYLSERLAVSVNCRNDKGTDSITCVTNFTVVKVDVEIDDISEANEETRGAVLPYMKDTVMGLLTEDGKANLLGVKITCEPDDLPQSERVEISAPNGYLYERVNGEYQPAQASYPACEIGRKAFFLHGHAVSSSLRDNAIEVSHTASGAHDVAKFTVYKFDFVVYVDQPVPGNRMAYNPSTGEVGHAFWELRYEGPSFEDAETIFFFTTYGNLINKPMGFYPTISPPPVTGYVDGTLVIPDVGHGNSVDVERTWFLSEYYYRNAIIFCSGFTLGCTSGRIKYSLPNYNCVNATVEVGNAANISLPQTVGQWFVGYGLNPGDFGEDLRAIPVW